MHACPLVLRRRHHPPGQLRTLADGTLGVDCGAWLIRPIIVEMILLACAAVMLEALALRASVHAGSIDSMGGLPASSASSSFTVKSQPIRLRYAEVHDNQDAPQVLALPEEVVRRYADGTRVMAVSGYEADIVDRHGRSVPLYRAYVHHVHLHVGRLNGSATERSLVEEGSVLRLGSGGEYRTPHVRHT